MNGYAAALAARLLIGLFLGGFFPTVVGLYTALFDRRTCGKLASFYNGTFNGSVVMLGIAVATIGGENRRRLLAVSGVPALLAAPFALICCPRSAISCPMEIAANAPRSPSCRSPSCSRRAAPPHRDAGADDRAQFFRLPGFTGWMTTYLKKVRHFRRSRSTSWCRGSSSGR